MAGVPKAKRKTVRPGRGGMGKSFTDFFKRGGSAFIGGVIRGQTPRTMPKPKRVKPK